VPERGAETPHRAARATAGYWPRPWTGEDGGPLRWGAAEGGLAIRPGERLEVTATRDAFGTSALVRREPGELYALRHGVPIRGPQSTEVGAWVERLDPDTLAAVASSGPLAGGQFWPGGIGVHANGDLYTAFGRWAHRLSVALEPLAARELPARRPHNSFVFLAGGELIVKDCDPVNATARATVSALEPEGLEPVAPPVELPEPVVARLSCDGDTVIALGTTHAFALRLDRAAGRLLVDERWRPAYGSDPVEGYGWDPVITDEHVLWMDNGRNHTDRTMLGAGRRRQPQRLWWARRDDGSLRSLEVSGLPFGTQSNPPGWDPRTKTVIAYDAGNAVVAAWRLRGDELEPLWRRDGLAHAGHLIVYPDTGEVVVGDWRDWAWTRGRLPRPPLALAMRALARFAAARRASLPSGHDDLVVLDVETGAEKARATVPSPTQGYLFPAPGWQRDVYYQSLTTIARVAVV
jgi:hypothetical protein